ncbi:hypothetical protein BH10ACI4_BH10ACI4_06000 [soil metagenome]
MKSTEERSSAMRRLSLRQRLIHHHLPLLVASFFTTGVLYFTRPYPDVISRASFATAYPALILVASTLATGPWNILWRRRNPVSSDLRRDIGIWAGVLGLGHSILGQMVHLRGRPWLYYVYEDTSRHMLPFRHDLFGFSNYTGLVSVLILIALLATSNDLSLRALGTPGWKRLQRWNYAAFALAAAHTFAYQSTEKNNSAFFVLSLLCLAIVIALQGTGYARRKAAIRRKLGGVATVSPAAAGASSRSQKPTRSS